jgi:hypothetical protein
MDPLTAATLRPKTPGEKTSVFFRRLSAFSRKQSFEVDILSSSKMSHISGQSVAAAAVSIAMRETWA